MSMANLSLPDMHSEPAPPTVSITFALTTDDIDALQRFVDSKRKESTIKWSLAVAVMSSLLLLTVGGMVWGVLQRFPDGVSRLSALVKLLGPSLVVMVLLAIFYFWAMSATRKLAHDQPGTFFAPRTVTISPEGYRETTQDSEFFHRWNTVSEIRNEEAHVYILLPDNNAATPVCVIPKQVFESLEQATAFVERARAFRRAVRSESVTA